MCEREIPNGAWSHRSVSFFFFFPLILYPIRSLGTCAPDVFLKPLGPGPEPGRPWLAMWKLASSVPRLTAALRGWPSGHNSWCGM